MQRCERRADICCRRRAGRETVCVLGAQNKRTIFFIDFLITLEKKLVGKCVNKPKGIVEKKKGGES